MAVIEGMKGVLDALDNVARAMEAKRARTLTRIGSIVKSAAVKNAPVDTGNLRASAYTELTDHGTVVIGFTAAYAAAVHEKIEVNRGVPRTSGTKRGFYWSGGGPKFLSRAVEQNVERIKQELEDGMRV